MVGYIQPPGRRTRRADPTCWIDLLTPDQRKERWVRMFAAARLKLYAQWSEEGAMRKQITDRARVQGWPPVARDEALVASRPSWEPEEE
jgi:hypothetical protein